jgi:hypothetical protein
MISTFHITNYIHPLRVRIIILPPIMLFLEPKHLLNLPITQRRLPLPHVPRHGTIRRKLLQELARRKRGCDGVVGRVEHLKPQPVLLHTQIAYLPQIPRVDITPRIPLAHGRILDIRGKISLILMRLDDIAYSERVDICVEAARETPGYPLAAKFTDGVSVHGIDVVGFVEREGGVIEVALAEADFVGCFGTGDYYLAHAEFAGGFDDVVCTCCIAAITFVVLGLLVSRGGRETSMFRTYRHEHIPGIRGEVNDRIGRAGVVRALVVLEAVVRGQRVEDLAAVGQVGFEGEDARAGVGEVGEVDVEDLVALGEEVGNYVAASFA